MRRRREQSEIFDGSEKKKKGKMIYSMDDNLEDTEDAEEGSKSQKEADQVEKVDLTSLQEESRMEQRTEVDDEIDILEAHVHPLDFDTMRKKKDLIGEIHREKVRIKCKFLMKYAKQDHDPFRIWSWELLVIVFEIHYRNI